MSVTVTLFCENAFIIKAMGAPLVALLLLSGVSLGETVITKRIEHRGQKIEISLGGGKPVVVQYEGKDLRVLSSRRGVILVPFQKRKFVVPIIVERDGKIENVIVKLVPDRLSREGGRALLFLGRVGNKLLFKDTETGRYVIR